MARYIDAELLKVMFAKRLNEHFGIMLKIDDVAVDLGLTIADMPTADVVEVKHGEWIKEDNGTQYWYQCSECSERPPYNRYKELWLSACCPNCGAKMDVSKMEITTEGGKAE